MTPAEPRDSNPFPGLRPFEPDWSALFFGRDEQTDQLLDKLARRRFVAVVGDSGSGKSSLVRAGLIPAIHLGYLRTGSRWRIAVMRPGSAPMRHLRDALAGPDVLAGAPDLTGTLERSSLGLAEAVKAGQRGETWNLLVVVDQFEELFRQARDQAGATEEQAHFVKLLLAASEQESVPIYVVLTMRSDSLGDCASPTSW